MQPDNIEGFNPAGGHINEINPNLQPDLQQRRYYQAEYGDTFNSVGSSTQQSNNGVLQGVRGQIQTNVSQGQLTTSKPVDPVKIIGDMISAGFKPTAYQISQAQNYVNGSSDTVKTWFAVLLMKMLRQLRKRRS
ncbi:MAG: hypothetical protein KatS3mg084_0586 [Candidatus Dojkabacteria bacterium]|nr:MAG: hypothetical protein KatS3mg084_0586 [Candidatus Dojkabacteria bacterium]